MFNIYTSQLKIDSLILLVTNHNPKFTLNLQNNITGNNFWEHAFQGFSGYHLADGLVVKGPRSASFAHCLFCHICGKSSFQQSIQKLQLPWGFRLRRRVIWGSQLLTIVWWLVVYAPLWKTTPTHGSLLANSELPWQWLWTCHWV